MDIKWKNKIKLVIWVLLFTFGLKGALSGFHIIANENQYFNNYFNTMHFEHTFNEFVNHLTFFELNEASKESAKEAIMVSEDEIKEHRLRYGYLDDQIENITYQYEDKIQNTVHQDVANVYIAERDAKIEDIIKNFKDDEHVRKKIVKEKEQTIDNYFKSLESNRTQFLKYNEMFQYYLEDTETGKVYTNVKVSNDESVEELFKEKDMHFIRSYPSDEYGYLEQSDYLYRFGPPLELEALFHSQQEKSYTGHIAISKSLPASNRLMVELKNHKQNQILFSFIFLLSIVALFLSLYHYKKTRLLESIRLDKIRPYYQRIPLDIRLISFFITMMLLPAFLTSGNVHYFYNLNLFYIVQDLIWLLIISVLFLTFTFIQAKLLFELLKDFDRFKEEWKRSILNGIYRNISDFFLIKSIATQLIILIGFIGSGFTFILFVAVDQPYYAPPFLIAFVVVCIPLLIFVFLRTSYLNRIITNVDEIVKGKASADLPVKGRSVLAELAQNINTLKHGVKSSQREQVKSERLKTELITNVSHDLRTPLTSIITYTELLKGSNVSSEDQNAYIEIIDRKSKRLKVLIDDLFEASKMASGNIELVKEKVDIVQLLQQALAEYNETMKQSTLQFRVTNPDTPVYAIVDGQKMWRVFDNLIANTIKYSLEHTRVYISVKAAQDQVTITFKNVTKYELGENIEELFERFKRGDTSRQTDGSGLGLAIAKSIVDLHEGDLDIELDGDLFKVTVTVPIK